MAAPPRAVLFDFDGVLADSEAAHAGAWRSAFADFGLDVPPEVCARAAEEDDRRFLAGVLTERKLPTGVEDLARWLARKQALTLAILAERDCLYPGVPSLVSRLQGRAELAVVTGTWRSNVDAVLGAAGLAQAFRLVVAKEDVTRTKPDPEAYRLAVNLLGVSANEAVALEDSPTGLASARGAGVRPVAVGHRRPGPGWYGDALFVPDLADVDRVMTALGLE